jgi:hypothetical protein
MMLQDLFLEIALAFGFVRWILSRRDLLLSLCALPRQDLAAMFGNLRPSTLTTNAATGMHAANANAG